MNSAELRAYRFKSAVAKVKQAFAGMSEEECDALIKEAVQWTRTGTRPAKSQTEKSPNTQ